MEAWVKLRERVPVVGVWKALLWGVEPLVAGNNG